jgi:hypothetical protein
VLPHMELSHGRFGDGLSIEVEATPYVGIDAWNRHSPDTCVAAAGGRRRMPRRLGELALFESSRQFPPRPANLRRRARYQSI